MSDKVNLLEKLGKARVDFQAAKIRKTGQNKFVGFDYYELCDILPKINELSNQYRFFCSVYFDAEIATLKIIDIDDQQQFVTFTSPMAQCNLKGAHDIQNMGAVQTYMRRYLYLMAFEIVENDTFDGKMGKKEGKNDTVPPKTEKPKTEQEKPKTEPPKNGVSEKGKLGDEIGKILKEKNPDLLDYFTEQEVTKEREFYKKTADIKLITSQLERLKKELAKRVSEFEPVPFDIPPMYAEQEFVDDIPE